MTTKVDPFPLQLYQFKPSRPTGQVVLEVKLCWSLCSVWRLAQGWSEDTKSTTDE